MTDGSSQGLFVVVTVVIFGIFVAISYSLFRDTLTPSLASIFGDVIYNSENDLDGFKPLDIGFSTTLSKNSYDFDLTNREKYFSADVLEVSKKGAVVIGLSVKDSIEIPWNHKVEYQFEVWHNGDSDVVAVTDPNSFPKGGVESSWAGNDNHGTNNITKKNVAPETWAYLEASYTNNHTLNSKNESLYEGSDIGIGSIFGFSIQSALDSNANTFKIRNVRYRIVPI